MALSGRIIELKKEKNAVVLAHNYQRPEVQDIADFVGDSLGLSRQASNTSADVIVFAGVDFMAETAKLVNPEKMVLVPDLDAHCPMAAMLSADDLKRVRRENPDAQTVMYVNTHADAKALADCVCTSANADRIINAMESDKIIFGPDRNLSYYVQKRTDKKIIIVPANGLCPTHHQLLLSDILFRREEYPDAKVVVHPECTLDVQDEADFIASTEGMVKYVKSASARDFIIGTESGLIHRLKKECPGKNFIPANDYMVCPNMKMNTLEKIERVLKTGANEITIPEEIAKPARAAINRMLEMSK